MILNEFQLLLLKPKEFQLKSQSFSLFAKCSNLPVGPPDDDGGEAGLHEHYVHQESAGPPVAIDPRMDMHELVVG